MIISILITVYIIKSIKSFSLIWMFIYIAHNTKFISININQDFYKVRKN